MKILTQGRNLEALCTNLDLKEGEGCLAKHGCGGDEGFSWWIHGGRWIGREFGEGDGKKRENGEKEDEDEMEVKECDKWMGFWVK